VEREAAIAEARGIVPLAEVLWKIRRNVRDAGLRRSVSTRAIIHLGSLHQADKERYGYRALIDRFFRGWSKQEREKACYQSGVESLTA
jgi:hypothetical protein